jgi:hypothetical protein
MDAVQVRAMKAQGLGASEIAKADRAGVLEAGCYGQAPPMAGQTAAERMERAGVSSG